MREGPLSETASCTQPPPSDSSSTGDAAFPGFLTRKVGYVQPPAGWNPILFRRLRMDLFAKSVFFHGTGGCWRSLTMLLKDGALATTLYRTVAALGRMHLGPIAAVLYKLNSMLTGAVIGRNAKLGEGLVILHTHGIVINSSIRAGKNLVLGHNVTIGTEKGRAPVLCDNVYIGTGAVIIGGIRVGNRARIGANAVVNKDVPDGATVAGVPARVIRMRTLEDTQPSSISDANNSEDN